MGLANSLSVNSTVMAENVTVFNREGYYFRNVPRSLWSGKLFQFDESDPIPARTSISVRLVEQSTVCVWFAFDGADPLGLGTTAGWAKLRSSMEMVWGKWPSHGFETTPFCKEAGS